MTDDAPSDESSHPTDETLFEFIDGACPSAGDDARRHADEADPRDAVAIMVKLGPAVAELSQDEFYALFDREEVVSRLPEAIEAYPLDSTERDDAVVLRVTGLAPEPKYYRAREGDVVLLSGREARNNWAVGHLDESCPAFDDHAMRYIESYRLFGEDGENRTDEIRRGNHVVDVVTSDEFMDALSELMELPEAERERVLDEWVGED